MLSAVASRPHFPRACWAVAREGVYGPLLYPTSITGTASMTLDFTVIHPVSRRGTEYTCDEDQALRVASPPHPELYTPRHCASSTISHATRRTPPSSTPSRTPQRRGATFALLSYTAHWEALGFALCLLTTPEISSTGPLRGRSFCLGSHRPRARVPLVVWAWEFCYAGSFLSLPRSPGPCSTQFFALRSATVLQKNNVSLVRLPAVVLSRFGLCSPHSGVFACPSGLAR